VNDDSVSSMAMGHTEQLDEATKKRIKESAVPFPEINYSSAKPEISLEPMMAKVDDKDAYVLDISSGPETKIKEYYDAETGLKLKREVSSAAGPQSTSYSDYRDVDGIKFPYLMTISSSVDIPLKVTDIKINSGLKADDFK